MLCLLSAPPLVFGCSFKDVCLLLVFIAYLTHAYVTLRLSKLFLGCKNKGVYLVSCVVLVLVILLPFMISTSEYMFFICLQLPLVCSMPTTIAVLRWSLRYNEAHAI